MKKTDVLAGLIAALPLAAIAEGPYIDVGTGANFSRDQRLYDSAGQQVGTLEYDEGIPGTLAAGYAFANGWRGDLEFGMRRNDVADGGSASSVDAGTMMAMLWFDWPFAWAVRPYAGAGAGQARLELNDAGAGTGGESDNVFAWQVAMGLASKITPRLVAHLDYRLVTADDAQFTGSGLRSDYQADSVLLGLRYFFKPVKDIRLADADAAAPDAQGPAAEAAAFETVTLRGVNFRFDESALTEPARQTLDRIAEDLLKEPGTRIVIEGHTDFIGTPDYNIALGERRANVVRDYLVGKGVAAGAIETRTYGETQPAEDNETPDGRAANRRAEFVAESAPPDVRVVVEPPTEASRQAAQGGEDPRIEQAPLDGSGPQEDPAPARE
jgi:outer membrane protein OmpA-like peptidoglycan-associated protein